MLPRSSWAILPGRDALLVWQLGACFDNSFSSSWLRSVYSSLRAAVTKSHELGDLNNRRGFPGDSVVKNSPAKSGDVGLIPDLGRSSGEGNGNSIRYSCLGNPMDRGTWWGYGPGIHKRVGWPALVSHAMVTIHHQVDDWIYSFSHSSGGQILKSVSRCQDEVSYSSGLSGWALNAIICMLIRGKQREILYTHTHTQHNTQKAKWHLWPSGQKPKNSGS